MPNCSGHNFQNSVCDQNCFPLFFFLFTVKAYNSLSLSAYPWIYSYVIFIFLTSNNLHMLDFIKKYYCNRTLNFVK